MWSTLSIEIRKTAIRAEPGVGRGRTTVVGTFHYISEGELLELEGEYTEHPLYGQQFHMNASR